VRFAEGGDTSAVKPVEQDPYYTMSGQSGEAFKYLMGQGTKPAAAARAPVAVSTGLLGLAQPTDGRIDGQGGNWVDDTSGNIKPYSFDPNTGTFTAAPLPKVWVPYAAPAITAFSGGDGGWGSFGDTGGGGNSGGVYGGGFVAANPADFGAVASSDPSQAYGGGDSTSASSADSTASDNSGVGGWAHGGIASLAQGGQSHLGDYSGGRLLRGPGDGVSDDIPATIGEKRPARLADGEFVVPARIVSELGNGSTEAGARKLYAMMDRVQSARKKSIGKDRVAVNSRAEKLLPV
jgi:hypothetical protein